MTCSSAVLHRLLPLRPRPRPGFPGEIGLPRPGRAPAALARGPRLPRPARGRDRQRRHRGDAGAGAGQAGRHTSPCCSARRPTCSRCRPRTRSRAHCRPGCPWRLVHALVTRWKNVLQWAIYKLARRRPDAARRRILARPPRAARARRPGAALQPRLQAVGSAHVRWCPTPTCSACEAGQGRGRHRHGSELHAFGAAARVGRVTAGRHRRHRDRPRAQLARRHAGRVDGQPIEPARQMNYKGRCSAGCPTSSTPSATPTRRGR
jgi:hypothetical protein